MDKIGRYELIEEIGHGGMGVVYRAHDTRLQREVALKLLPAYLSQEATFAQRFQQEARVVAQLEHPHIVPVYDVGEYQKRPYLVMRLLKGGTLRQRLTTGSMTTAELIGAIHQVSQALDIAHGQGIVHRDIKPSNILFDEQGTAFVTDFGVAKVLDTTIQLTGSGVVGTPAYMSPEHFTGQGLDGRSDQYSLAVVVYEALAGDLPFNGKTVQQLIYQHLETLPPNPHHANPDLPPILSPVLAQALAKRPADRFPTTGSFAQALDRALSTLAQVSAPSEIPATSTLLPAAKRSEGSSKTTAAQKLQRAYGQGLQALADKDWEAAANAFARVLEMEPDHPNARSRYKEACYYLTRYKRSDNPPSPVSRPAPKRQIVHEAGGQTETGHKTRYWWPATILIFLLTGSLTAWALWPKPEVEMVIREVTATWAPETSAGLQPTVDNVNGPGTNNIVILEPADMPQNLRFDPAKPLPILAEKSLRLQLPDGTELFIAAESELEIISLAAQQVMEETVLLLREGSLVLETPATVHVMNVYGATAVVIAGTIGVTFTERPFRFNAACFSGMCRLMGDMAGELSLRPGESGFVGGSGQPGEQVRAADYTTYAAFAAIIPTSTSTPTPTNTPTRTPTTTPTATQPPATATATAAPTGSPTRIPLPLPPPTATPTTLPYP